MLPRQLLLLQPGGTVADAPAPFVSDTFTDADTTALTSHTGETGATWDGNSAYGEDAAINNNRLDDNFGAGGLFVASGLPAGAEYDIVLAVVVVGTPQGFVGAVARSDNNEDTGANQYVAVADVNASKLRLELWTDGGPSSVLDMDAWTPAGGTLKFEVRNAAKKLYWNDVERCSSADNSIATAGKVGVLIGGGAWPTDGILVDSITATDA